MSSVYFHECIGGTSLALNEVLWYICATNAGIAQLVERNLAKVDVAGSNPVSRSASSDRGKGNIR